MDNRTQCPVCASEIPLDRHFHDTMICECGWTQTKSLETTEFKQSKRVGIQLAIMGALLIACFTQAVNWDKYFFTIIPLKVKQWTSQASVQDLEEISKICAERNKHLCVEVAFYDLYVKTNDRDYLSQLGHVQFAQGKTLQALDTYERYFQAGGKNGDARYEFAQALGETGNFSEAQKQYRSVLRSKPGVLQFTVARKYVELLISNGKYDSANYVIQNYRKRSKSSSSWMEKELKSIKKFLKKRSHASL